MSYPKSARFRGKRFVVHNVTSMKDCGMCGGRDDKPRLWINVRQSDKDLLGTLIHEGLHAGNFDLSEEAVTEMAEDITRLVWKYGYRSRRSTTKA